MASIVTYSERPDKPETSRYGSIEDTRGVWIRTSQDGLELELFHDGKFVAAWKKPSTVDIPVQFLAMMDELYKLGVRNSLSKKHVLEWLKGTLRD
jgi:hypothetical protein